jgi:hypothetical protein
MIYFFENKKKEVFAIDDPIHAWNEYSNRNNDKYNTNVYIGQSDGSEFKRIKAEKNAELGKVKAEIISKEQALDRYEVGLTKLYEEKFLTDDNEEVKRAKRVIKKTREEFTALVQARNKQAQTIHKEAMEEEVKRARKNTLPPLDIDLIEGSEISNRSLLDKIKR